MPIYFSTQRDPIEYLGHCTFLRQALYVDLVMAAGAAETCCQKKSLITTPCNQGK
jgi:hypothetical protein